MIQGTGTPFVNPGRTGGLRGRKRDCTEGGIREIGLVEAPWLAAEMGNREERTCHLECAIRTLIDTLVWLRFTYDYAL
jgi:hypothetical protein